MTEINKVRDEANQAMNIVTRRRTTLVRRVSDMFKDGNYCGPPLLFRHSSMQKIRHCCQNLNLFPYLLYSFGNSKPHPVARKVNVCVVLLLKTITERIFLLNSSFRRIFLQGLCPNIPCREESVVQDNLAKPSLKFCKFEKQKRKQISLLLTLAVYFALTIVVFQLVGLCSLLISGKYTPGFIFLVIALLFLGYISLKIMVHNTVSHGFKREKRKA